MTEGGDIGRPDIAPKRPNPLHTRPKFLITASNLVRGALGLLQRKHPTEQSMEQAPIAPPPPRPQERFPKVPTQEPPTLWEHHGNSFTDYQRDFGPLNAEGFLDGIFAHLQEIDTPIVVDLMASPEAVYSFKTTVLHDKPMLGFAAEKQPEAPDHTLQGQPLPAHKSHMGYRQDSDIHHVEADLNKGADWDKLLATIDHEAPGRNVNLWMARPFGGLQYIPTDLRYQRAVLGRMWEHTDANGGAMILQIPPAEVLQQRGISINTWVEQLREAGIKHKYIPSYISSESVDRDWQYGLIALVKNGDQQLPTLLPNQQAQQPTTS